MQRGRVSSPGRSARVPAAGWVAILLSLAVTSSAAAQQLTKAEAHRLLVPVFAERAEPSEIHVDRVDVGSFTRAGAREALISVYCMGCWSHAEGWHHVFVARHEGRWRILGDAGFGAVVQVRDTDGDGLPEVKIEWEETHQGNSTSGGAWWSLRNFPAREPSEVRPRGGGGKKK